MAIGDGAIVRAGLDALLDLLHKFAAPTGERGSVLLMSGGLIVLGFLFLAFLFRSAIVGDLAPVANARLPAPRALLPPASAPHVAIRSIPPHAFEDGRKTGRAASPIVDRAFEHVRKHGADARILQSNAHWKLIRLYGCSSCAVGRGSGGTRVGFPQESETFEEGEHGPSPGGKPLRGVSPQTPLPQGCELERGLLAGAFEAMTGDLAKVHEVACVGRGDAHCEFEVRHAALLEVLV